MSDSIAASAVADVALLIERAQRGELSAFDELVRRHQQAVYSVAFRMLGDAHEAEDVAHDTFIQAFRALKQFRGESKLSTWLIAIVMNRCRNRRRSLARQRAHIAASLDAPRVDESGDTQVLEVAATGPSPHDQAVRKEQTALIALALQQLDAPQRSVVVLRDVQGYPYEEIAQIERCNIGTVKSRLHRARLQLKTLLNGRL